MTELPAWAQGSRPFRLPAAETNSGAENFVAGWMQQSFLARTAEEFQQRMAAFGAWAPPPVEGYSPFAAPGELLGYEDSLHLFRLSRSPEETAFLRRRVDALRARQADLAGAGFLGQFLAGVVTPENLLTLPLGIGPAGQATRLGRAAAGAGRGAALAGAQAAAEGLLATTDLPTTLQPDLVEQVALSALFGAALGGAAGAVSARSLDAAAARHAFVHDRADGLRTPGVPRSEPTGAAASGASPEPPPSAVPRLDSAAEPSVAGVEVNLPGAGWTIVGRDGQPRFGRTLDDFDDPLDRPTWRTEPRVTEEAAAAAEDLLAQIAGRHAQLRLEDLPPGHAGLALNNIVAVAWSLANERQVRWGVRHESIHVLRNFGVLTPAEWATLERAANAEDWIGRFRIDRRYSHLARPDQIEEAIAERFALWAQRAEHGSPEVNSAFAKLRDFFIRLFNALRGRGFDSPDSIFRRIEGGEMPGRIGPGQARLIERSTIRNERMMDSEVARIWDRFASEALDNALQLTGEDGARAMRADPAAPHPALAGREGSDRLAATGTGMERLRVAELPYYRLKNNGFTGAAGNMIARLADQIVQIPGLRLRGNAAGHATDTASVEARAAQATWRYAAAERRQAELYYAYRGWDPEKAGPVRARAQELRETITRARPDGTLSFAEFDQAVGLAVATGEHRIPQVAEAAAFWRREFYEPFEREGAEAGVLLAPRHRDAAAAALRRERATAEAQAGRAMDEIMARAGIAPEQRAAAEAARAKLAPAEDALRDARRFADESRETMTKEDTQARRIQMAEAIQAVKKATAARDALLAEAEAPMTAARGKAGADPLLGEWLALHAELDAQLADIARRQETLTARHGRIEPYVPHRWLFSEVRARRDELAARIARWWEAESGHSWAASGIRAELAISHLLREGIGPALVRVLRRHLIDQGMEPELATSRAAEGAAGTQALLARTEPSRLHVEIASALGQRIERTPDADVPKAVRDALAAAGVRGLDGSDDLDRLVREIVGSGSAPHGEWGDRARPGHTRERTINLPTGLLWDFLDLSQRAGGAEYARRMGAAIAMSRKFGDPSMLGRLAANRVAMLEEAAAGRGTVEELRAVTQATRDLRDKVLGSFRIPEDPDAYSVRALRFLINNAVLVQLGAGLRAQIADFGRIVMAQGIERAFGGLLDSFGPQASAFRRGGDETAKAGAALEMVTLGRARALHDLDAIGADRTLIERWAQSGAETMLFVNGMVPWTQWAQRFAGALIQGEMVELAAKAADGQATRQEITRLAAYGIDEAAARRIAAEWRAAGAERHGRLALANTDAWADAELRDTFRAALKTAVDAAVMKPDAADRPNFLSRPLMQAMFLYKSFGIAATQRMLMAGLQQRDMRVLAGVLSSVAIAWLIAGPAGGEHDKNPIRSWERLFTAIERSGAVGVIGDLNNAIELLSGNQAGLRPMLGIDPPAFAANPTWAQQAAAVGGPTLAPWLNVVWALTDPEATGNQAAGAIRRTLWFNNLIYLDWLFRALAREAGTAMEADSAGHEPAPPLPAFMGGRAR